MSELLQDIDLSLVKGFMNGIKPDAIVTVSEWSDAKRILPETSAEPGKFRTSRTPYAKEIMDKLAVSNPAQKIVFKKGSQIGATEIGNNWLGYSIDVAPCSFLYIMPTDGFMTKTSKERIEPMLKSVDEIREKMGKLRSKDSNNTLLYKKYPGGSLYMVGANSPVGLASSVVRNVYADEIDRYPESVGGEGSAIDLADTRTSTFGNRRKILLSSTPTKKGISQIDAEFEKTGQRYYHVPCPNCKEYQVLVFDQLRYEIGKFQDIKYECIHCKYLIDERFKTRMMAEGSGKWIPKFPEKEDGYTFGYHLSAMYSPYGMYSWARMAQDYENSKGDVPKSIVFTNTKLGECYEEVQGEKPDWENIYNRAESYDRNIPFKSVAFITAGVDVQADRLEIEIVGWIKGKQSQSLDYRVIIGDTTGDDVWKELSKIVNETFIREDGAIMSIRYMAVDSGHNTDKVYEFTQKHSINRVIPVKGRDNLQMFYSAPKTLDVAKGGKKIGKVKVWHVGVSMIKGEVYGFLKLNIDHDGGEIPHGYCHFPKYDIKYFRGLTAEEIVQVKNSRGYDAYEWRKKYKFNEPLDCRVYARAAASIVGMDRWDDARWLQELNTQWETRKTNNSKPANKKSSFWR